MMILLLSSEVVVRTALREVLENAGYVVAARGDLGSAVDTIKDTRIDLLITRPYIENISGHEAAKYLREKDPNMAVMIVAGMLDDDRLTYRAELEHFAIFPQPFTAAQFVGKVKDVLKGSKRKHEAHLSAH